MAADVAILDSSDAHWDYPRTVLGSF